MGSSTARIAGPSGPALGWAVPAPTAMRQSPSPTCSPRKCCPAPWVRPVPFPPAAPAPRSDRSLPATAPRWPSHLAHHGRSPPYPHCCRRPVVAPTLDWPVNRKAWASRNGSTRTNSGRSARPHPNLPLHVQTTRALTPCRALHSIFRVLLPSRLRQVGPSNGGFSSSLGAGGRSTAPKLVSAGRRYRRRPTRN